MELPIRTRYIPVSYILPYFICIYVVLFYQLLYCYVCIVFLYACCTLSENDEIKLINQSINQNQMWEAFRCDDSIIIN